jgi:hypothetical protein
MTEGATEAIREARQDGRKATARALQRDVSVALERTEGKDGEYVSLPSNVAASLAAFGSEGYGRVPEASRHSDAVSHYLEQYGYW